MYSAHMIEQREKGWYVFSDSGRRLGGPYRNRYLAERRSQQVEYFTRKREIQLQMRML